MKSIKELFSYVGNIGHKVSVIKSIHIHWCEGWDTYPEDQTFTLLEANEWLETIARDMKLDKQSGYNKVKFTATLFNGEEYTGRFDVNPLDKEQDNRFNQLCFYSHMLSYAHYNLNDPSPFLYKTTLEEYRAVFSKWMGWMTDELPVAV